MPKKDRLIFLPLGGAGEIGMNMYLYGYGPEGSERFIMVDVGVTFPSMDGTPGVDLIMPETAWIEKRLDRLDAIFITHAHEDHIGALGHLYPRLRAPIYCRRFTATVAHAKMEDRGQDSSRIETVPPYPEMVKAGPFKVGILPMSHSIPEASGLVIETPNERVVHTGDFKLDTNPIVGEAFDPKVLEAIGKKGVTALVCDSTNVFSDHKGRSESTVREPIANLVKTAEGMVVATTFASNIARLKSLAQAGVDAGRSVVMLGRAMQRMLGYAHGSNVLQDFPPLIDVEDAQHIPRENLMLIVTGSQGERRAASAQLANGKYLGMTMKEGDMFLFSSKTIPGNEVSVGRIVNQLAQQGVKVVDDSSGEYHVSGHANRPDLVKVHELIKPKMLIPMHGEFRHLKEHAELARQNGIPAEIVPNGAMVSLSGKAPHIVEHIETGRIYLDGSRLIGAYDGVVLERIRMATRGFVSVSVVVEDDEILGVWAEPHGLPELLHPEEPLPDLIEAEIETVLSRAKPAQIRDDEAIEEMIARVVSRICRDEVGKKPVSRVMVNRLV